MLSLFRLQNAVFLTLYGNAFLEWFSTKKGYTLPYIWSRERPQMQMVGKQRIYGTQSDASNWMVDIASTEMRPQEIFCVYLECKMKEFSVRWLKMRRQGGFRENEGAEDFIVGTCSLLSSLSWMSTASTFGRYKRDCVSYTYSNSWTYADKEAGYTRLSFSREVWIVDKKKCGRHQYMDVLFCKPRVWMKSPKKQKSKKVVTQAAFHKISKVQISRDEDKLDRRLNSILIRNFLA